MGEYENGKPINMNAQKSVDPPPPGGNAVTDELLRHIQEFLGNKIEEFKQMFPHIWSCVEARIDDVKKVDEHNARLELGYLGEWLLEQGFNQERSNDFKLYKTDRGRVLLEIPLQRIERSFDVITKSEFMRDVKRCVRSTPYEYIFLVGGMANSRIVKNQFKHGLKAKIFIPPSPESYAMVGASCLGAIELNTK